MSRLNGSYLLYHPSAITLLSKQLNSITYGWAPMRPFHRASLFESTSAPIIIVAFSARFALRNQLNRYQPAFDPIFVYVDTPTSISAANIIELGPVHGVFYEGAQASEVRRGLHSILDGEVWFDRQLSSRLLTYYSAIIIRHTPPHKVRLTPREAQVLRLLRRGSSNIRLADTLCLSEHTIKSHLYRIYRKLEVNSRQQAAEWAHHYLEDRI